MDHITTELTDDPLRKIPINDNNAGSAGIFLILVVVMRIAYFQTEPPFTDLNIPTKYIAFSQ